MAGALLLRFQNLKEINISLKNFHLGLTLLINYLFDYVRIVIIEMEMNVCVCVGIKMTCYFIFAIDIINFILIRYYFRQIYIFDHMLCAEVE